jgi:glycosyltransferase involved in cell wall biosynthesis
MAHKLSAAIIAFNEEAKLSACLSSLNFVDEICLLDSGSTDKTREIAESFGAIVEIRHFDNFSSQKNAAISSTHGDWILLIDADERVTPELQQSILNIVENIETTKHSAFRLNRLNQIFGGKIRYGASGIDQPIRLIRRGKAHYEGLVHEQLEVSGSIGLLTGELTHITYQTLDDYYKKFNLFSTLDAKEMLRRKDRIPSFGMMILRPWLEFFYYYIIKRGFLDGYRGFLYQVLSSYYVFIKYAKIRELAFTDKTKKNDMPNVIK